MPHYFSENPQAEHSFSKYTMKIFDKTFMMETDSNVFSKNALDFGSRVLIETFLNNKNRSGTTLLDMGCGYGPIAISIMAFCPEIAATLADINERALSLARKNCQSIPSLTNRFNIVKSFAFDNINDTFDYIVINPPIRAGKDVIFKMYEGAFEKLNHGGQLYVVIQKKQGAPSTQSKLNNLFGNCQTLEKKSGYHIFMATKGM